MKKVIMCCIMLGLICLSVNCGGGSSSSSTSSTTSNVSGTYYGVMHWAGQHWDKGPYTTDQGYFRATLQQNGSIITGSWEITAISDGHYVTHGTFEQGTINGTTITAIMEDNGIRFDDPFSFTGNCDGNTFSGSGILSWCGHWDTTWSCPRES